MRVGRLGGAEDVQQKASREVCGEVTCVMKENERRPIWDVVLRLWNSEVIRRNQVSFYPCAQLFYIWQGPSFEPKRMLPKNQDDSEGVGVDKV